MRLHEHGVSYYHRVDEPKMGLRFSLMELDDEDFRQLAKKSPEQLHAWLLYWQLGFSVNQERR